METTERAELSAELAKKIIPEAATSFEGPVTAAAIRCIDGRRLAEGSRAAEVAFPGANLGVAIDVAAATSRLVDAKGNHPVLSSEFAARFIGKIEEAIGALTYHTDDHGHGLSCAGCGYCNASLVEPDAFFVPQAFAESFAAHLPQVDDQLREDNVPVAVYTGSHDEQAVVMVMHPGLSIPPRIGADVGAYVVNVPEWTAQLQKAADATHGLVTQELSMEITPEEWSGMVQAVAGDRVNKVKKEKLKADTLPHYYVDTDASGTVFAMTQAEFDAAQQERVAA